MSEFVTYRAILTTIALLHPDMTITQALEVAEEAALKARIGGSLVIDSTEDFANFAETQASVTGSLPHRPIEAIKTLRAIILAHPDPAVRAHGGLKECKEAVDEVRRRRGEIPR